MDNDLNDPTISSYFMIKIFFLIYIFLPKILINKDYIKGIN